MATAIQMCSYCGRRPKYFDGSKYLSYCGMTCKNAAQGSSGAPLLSLMPSIPRCTVPGCNRAAWRNPQGQYTAFCSKTCRDNNSQSSQQRSFHSVTPALGSGNLGTRACIICKVRPYDRQRGSLFCGTMCVRKSEAMIPAIIEIPNDHPKFYSVANQFRSKWLHSNSKPTPAYIYLIVGNGSHIASYNAYCNRVESQGNFASRGRPYGDYGNTQLCSSTNCALCSIIRNSFDLKFYKKKTSWGRFGRGIYTSATSSKGDSYTKNNIPSLYKAMLLNMVVVGEGYKLSSNDPTLTAPPGPPGKFHSVLGEPASSGSLNYDEVVVYDNDAIRPIYLIIY